MNDVYTQFETNPKAVKRWLDNLPIASVGETARQLYMAMRDVNRKDAVSVKHHFTMLEGICEPLSLILPELHRHYAGKPLPLSQKRRKVADLYTQLLRQVILGYQNVIAHSIELNRFGWKKVVTTAVHRIFSFSSMLLCNYRQLYMPYQKGMWLQLYWIYQLVEKYNLLNVKVQGVNGQRSKTTLAAEFKKLLLHSLLSPNLFRPEELKSVIDSLELWERYATIDMVQRGDHQHVYAFTLETDLAPCLIAQGASHADNQMVDVRYLDISELLRHLNKLLDHTKPVSDTIKLSRTVSVSRRSLVILLNSWGRPASRDGERRLIQGQAEIAIGVSAIHYVIANGRAHAKPQVQPEPVTAAEPIEEESNTDSSSELSITLAPVKHNSSGQLSFTTDREPELDVWDAAYFEPKPVEPSWTESMRMKVYSYLNAKVLNISKGGFCVALPQDGIEHIQTNEFVAVRGKADQWQLGEIRWMVCPTLGPIRAGVKKLSQTIKPAELHFRTGLKAQPIKCLLGKDNGESILFMPNLPLQIDSRNLLLEFDGEKRKIRLQELLSQSPVGVSYRFEFVVPSSAQHRIADDNDECESVWASL